MSGVVVESFDCEVIRTESEEGKERGVSDEGEGGKGEGEGKRSRRDRDDLPNFPFPCETGTVADMGAIKAALVGIDVAEPRLEEEACEGSEISTYVTGQSPFPP